MTLFGTFTHCVQSLHPADRVPVDSKWFLGLDLKGACPRFLIGEQAQQLFALEWQGPETEAALWYCWTALPRGFKSSPTIFGEVLAKDFGDVQ